MFAHGGSLNVGVHKRYSIFVCVCIQLTYVGRVRLEPIRNDARVNQAWVNLLDRHVCAPLCDQFTEIGHQLVASDSYRRFDLPSLSVRLPDSTFVLQSHNDAWKCIDMARITRGGVLVQDVDDDAAAHNVFPPHVAMTLATEGTVDVQATVVLRAEWVYVHTSKAKYDIVTGDTKQGQLLVTVASIDLAE